MEKDVAETKDIIIAVLTSTDIVSNIKGYHVSKSVWTPILQEQVYGETELHDSVDKYAVAVKKVEKVVGHLPLRENGKFPKTIFYYLCADRYEKCNITVTGKAVNLGDGDGMQVHSILHLSGQKSMVEMLKQQKMTSIGFWLAGCGLSINYKLFENFLEIY